jgi:hypothetical protein
MITASQKHVYVENGLARFALATVARYGSDEPQPGLLEPDYILNGHSTQILANEKSVIEAASQGIRDAEKELHWSGEPHSLMSLEGLLVDGIDAEAARIAARKATESLIQNR